MKRIIFTKFHVNRMNYAESRRGVRFTPPPPPKCSCNYFFFEASRPRLIQNNLLNEMAGSCSTVYSLWQVTVERFGIKHLAGMALHEVCFANVADYEAPAVTRVSVVNRSVYP